MQNLEKEIKENLTLSSNYDPDRQYMAIKNLSDIIVQNGEKMDQTELLRIIDTILKFLDDENKVLQGLAIDRLSKMIVHIPTEGNRRICVQMITKLADPSVPDEFRGIYSTALKSIIKEVSFELGSQLKEMLVSLVKQLLEKDESKYNKIQELMIEVVDAFISKWPTMSDCEDLPKMKFARLLLNNVIHSSHLTKSSASSLCLGKISGTMKQQELEEILYKDGLISFVGSGAPDKSKKLAYSTLRMILLRHNREMVKFVKELLDFLFKQIQTYKNDKTVEDDSDRLELVCDIVQLILLSVLAIVQYFPKQIKTHMIVNQNYVADISNLVSYSPGASIAYLQDKMEADDDYYDDDEEDFGDSNESYRVRRVATTLAGHMSKLDQSLGEEFIRLKGLYDRLLEAKSEVRESAFDAFETIVLNITVEESTKKLDIENIELYPLKRAKTKYKDVAGDFLDRLLKKLKELTSKNSIDQKSALESAKLLAIVCKSFASIIAESKKQLLPLVLGLLTKELQKYKSVPEIKAAILDAFSSLFIKEISDDKIEEHLHLMISSIDDNSQVSLQAFKAIDNLLQTHIADLGEKSPNVKALIPVILNALANANYKPETRKAVVQCTSQLLNSYPNYLDPEELVKILKQLSSKLINESSKKSTLVALTKLSPQLALSKSVIEVLNNVLVQLTNNFINHQNDSVAQCAQEAVAKIIQILQKNFTKQSAKQLVQTSKQIKGTFPKYLDAVLQLYPALFKDSLNDLFNSDELPIYVIEELLKAQITTPAECHNLIKAKARPENIDNVVKMLRVLSSDEKPYLKEVGDNVWGRVALRFIGDCGKPENYEFLKGYAFGNYDADTKYHASIALGSLVAKNFNAMIPGLLENLKSANDENIVNAYLCIKQAIVRSDISNYEQIDNAIQFLLQDDKTPKSGPVVNILSECIAKIVNFKPFESDKILSKILHDPSIAHKQMFATMFRFLDKDVLADMDFIRPKINQLIELLTEKHPFLRAETLKSLTFLINEAPHAVLYSIDENSFRLIRQCSLIDDSLIREEVIVIKTVVDDGKPMRLQAFLLFETAMEKPTNTGLQLLGLHPQILQAALDRMDDEKEFAMFLQRLILIKAVATQAPEALAAQAAKFRKSVEPRILSMDPEARYAKNVLECFERIYLITKKDFSSEIEEMYFNICKKPEFKKIILQIEKEYE